MQKRKPPQFFLYKTVFLFLGLIFTGFNFSAAQANIDFSKSIIVTPAKMGRLEQKAVSVLQEEIQKRTGIHLQTSKVWPKQPQPVITIGLETQIHEFAGSFVRTEKTKKPGKEGFQLFLRKGRAPVIVVAGHDSRGVFYGMGRLLRELRLKSGSINIPDNLDIVSTPRYRIRGHQLGYRPKTNAYDAWSAAQFDQYIRELAIFGANSIEIMPPRTDDDRTSPHMKMPAMQMIIKQAQIADSYGMDVWMWYPNMGSDYSTPDSIEKELQERDIVFKKIKHLDAVLVPGGDPGDLHPDILFAWLKRVAEVLHKYHPGAKIWVSPQAFRPTKDWLDAFYEKVNRHYPWFGGVVFGPWIKTPLPEMRKIVDADIPIRRYPDITHSISCQYPVKDWDLAFAMTLGRECYNPRPLAEKAIHNALDEYANGSLSYSEGINDDVNKFIWSSLDWDPNTPVIEILRQYSRFFVHPDLADDMAHGLIALEKNWQGSLLSNASVDGTLRQWQDMEKFALPQAKNKYRFQMGLLRAYYDAYIRERLINETALQRKAIEILRMAGKLGSEQAINLAESILKQKEQKPVAQDYKQKCWQIAEYLFQAIGSQTSVQKFQAQDGRGNFMDYIDVPLNDAIWLLSQFKSIRAMNDESNKLTAIHRIIHRTDPGPGGFYDNLGISTGTPRLDSYPAWQEDPGSLKSPRVSFGVGLHGEEWVHTVQAKGFDGKPTPLAWMNQLTTLYDTPLNLIYTNLDPQAEYVVRVAYTGRFRAQIRLVADDSFQIHKMMKTGKKPIWEFPIPKEATQDGKLKLAWTCGEGERGAQVAEVWVIRKR